jgi:hypothetical protein
VTTTGSLAVVGVFNDQHDAQQAILELKQAGFLDDQIGVAARHLDEPATSTIQDLRKASGPGESYVAEGTVTGVAAGAGLGALCGLAILIGLLPPLGPAIAGGTLAVILTSAAAGAAAVGLAGALAGLGVSKEEAAFYQTEFEAGRVVVAVTAGDREQEARSILQRFGAYDMADQTDSAEARPEVTPATLSAAETRTPVAMPMEPGVPARVNLAGEAIEPPSSTLDVPVRSEDLVGDGDAAARRSTVRVPVQQADLDAVKRSDQVR